MSRKDYVRIAEALKTAHERSGLSTGWACAVDAIADALQADNARFSRDRFMSAVNGAGRARARRAA